MVETSGRAHPKGTRTSFVITTSPSAEPARLSLTLFFSSSRVSSRPHPADQYSGEFVSPFEVIGEHSGYSSSDESSECCTETVGQSSANHLAGSPLLSSSTVENNHGDSLEGTLCQPRSINEHLPNISVVSLSRNNLNPAIGVEEILCELERLGFGDGVSYADQKGLSRPEESTCEERVVTEEGERTSPDRLDNQESLSWITDVQVDWCPIGQGSYGKVYRAVADDQVYALKIVEASSRCRLRKLAAEAHANMLLKHENVVHCFNCCFMTNGLESSAPERDESVMELWMLQELCEGGTLDEAVRGPAYPPGNDRLSRERILTKLSAQIAKGLEYIHSHGQIHGDLSSNNVLLSLPHEYAGSRTDPTMWEHVTLKIADFGRSKEKGVGSCRTDSIGTVTFMPPEALTTGSLVPSSDIYAYGVILMQLWTGELPYQEYNFAQIIFETSQGRTPQVSLDMDAPDFIKRIIRQCVSPLPADRPTVSEIRGLLNGLDLMTCLAEQDEQDDEK